MRSKRGSTTVGMPPRDPTPQPEEIPMRRPTSNNKTDLGDESLTKAERFRAWADESPQTVSEDADTAAAVDRDAAAAAEEARRDTTGRSPEDAGRPGTEPVFRDRTNPLAPDDPSGSSDSTSRDTSVADPLDAPDLLDRLEEERSSRDPAETFVDSRSEFTGQANAALGDAARSATGPGGPGRSSDLISGGAGASWVPDGEEPEPVAGVSTAGVGIAADGSVTFAGGRSSFAAENPGLEQAANRLYGVDRIEAALRDDPARPPSAAPVDANAPISTRLLSSGTTISKYHDGSTVTTYTDGKQVTKNADGSVHIRRSDGSTTTSDADGNITETPPTKTAPAPEPAPDPAPAPGNNDQAGQPSDDEAYQLSPEKRAILDGVAGRLAPRGGGGDGHTDPGDSSDPPVGGSGPVPDATGSLLTGGDGRADDVVETGGGNSSGPDFNGNAGAIDPGPEGSAPSGGGRSEDPFDRLTPNLADESRITAPETPAPLVDTPLFGSGASLLDGAVGLRPGVRAGIEDRFGAGARTAPVADHDEVVEDVVDVVSDVPAPGDDAADLDDGVSGADQGEDDTAPEDQPEL
jgi:hypothetical protein